MLGEVLPKLGEVLTVSPDRPILLLFALVLDTAIAIPSALGRIVPGPAVVVAGSAAGLERRLN